MESVFQHGRSFVCVFLIIQVLIVTHKQLFYPLPASPQWGTADAEIKNPPDGSEGLSKVPLFKPGVGI